MGLLQYQMWLLAPLVLVLVLMMAFAIYVFYSSDRRYRLKLVLGPALILTAYFSFVLVGAHLGYAYPAKLPKKFLYLDHAVVMSTDGTKKEWIDIFLISKDPWSDKTRLQRIPWSKNMEEAAKQAQSIRRGGGVASMERKDGKPSADEQSGSSDGDEYPDYIPKRVMPQDVLPKEPPGESPPLNRDNAEPNHSPPPSPKEPKYSV